MRQKKKSLKSLFFLVSSLLTGIGFIAILIFLPPDYQVNIVNLKISIMYLFFTVLFLFLFSIGTALFKSKTQGLLISLFIISYLVFRINNFTHPFFFILLASLFLTLELLFTYRK